MRRPILPLALALALLWAVPAGASHGPDPEPSFGLHDLKVSFTDPEGLPMRAGTHPEAFVTELAANTEQDPALGEIPAGQLRDLHISYPPGIVGSPEATPRCEGVDFATHVLVESGLKLPNCSNSSVVGLIAVEGADGEGTRLELRAPLFNLVPPPGTAAKFGFLVPLLGTPVTFTARVNPDPPYNLIVDLENTTQAVRFFSSEATVWGNPSDSSHDTERGRCGFRYRQGLTVAEPGGECPTSNPNVPFLTLPRSCTGPLETAFGATSWAGDTFAQSVFSEAVHTCSNPQFDPPISARPTAEQASAPSGLAFEVEIEDEGLVDPEGTADSDVKKAVVTLPEGMTINPSQAEGLEVCSESELAREQADSEFGSGCPRASKIGSVQIRTPLLPSTLLEGSVFVAEPYKNRFGTLLALYVTVREPELGVIFRLAGKVEPDPATGQLVTTFDDLPQWPFSRFTLRLREGGRSPLITPELCGSYETVARFTPWARPASSVEAVSAFEIVSGPGGGACPAAGAPPFVPDLEAGTLNNAAGEHSPFLLRLTRRDGDQDMVRFDSALPPGLLARLAGVSRCSEARIAQTKARSGTAELASPSCPAGSRIGSVLAGAGVGSQLTYVPGAVYLAGPFAGAPLSVLGVVPAVAGPFDVGTVVTRQALRVDPRSAEVTVDGKVSDPIPHILAGIPLKVRDIRVLVDRPAFTLNPTSCEPMEIGAQLWGGGANPFSLADDAPTSLARPFQAAGCASLPFDPRLALKLSGGTERGAHPALRAVVRPREGGANIEGAVVRLPRSAFLEQGHIRTICTRVQFAAEACPKGAVYGRVRAFTPLLSEPLEGPVYLRSSNHNLPDLVFDLHGLVDFEAVGRIDSVRGGIRTTFAEVPDAPISKVVLRMQGGRKGLIVNSTDLCEAKHRVDALFTAHNGARKHLRPLLRARGCGN